MLCLAYPSRQSAHTHTHIRTHTHFDTTPQLTQEMQESGTCSPVTAHAARLLAHIAMRNVASAEEALAGLEGPLSRGNGGHDVIGKTNHWALNWVMGWLGKRGEFDWMRKVCVS